jgi:hypothetical protein
MQVSLILLQIQQYCTVETCRAELRVSLCWPDCSTYLRKSLCSLLHILHTVQQTVSRYSTRSGVQNMVLVVSNSYCYVCYCYVCSILCILSHCVDLCIVCV